MVPKGISIASILEMRAKGGGGGGKKGGDDEGVEEEAELDEGQVSLVYSLGRLGEFALS